MVGWSVDWTALRLAWGKGRVDPETIRPNIDPGRVLFAADELSPVPGFSRSRSRAGTWDALPATNCLDSSAKNGHLVCNLLAHLALRVCLESRSSTTA